MAVYFKPPKQGVTSQVVRQPDFLLKCLARGGKSAVNHRASGRMHLKGALVGLLEVFVFLASKHRHARAEFVCTERLRCGQPFQSGHKVHNLSTRCGFKGR
jgi:hypothetical protein